MPAKKRSGSSLANASKPKVWFARGDQAADHYLTNYRDAYVEEWPSFYGTGKARPKEKELARAGA